MPTIYPVILSGGSGTRLWPLSRAAYPKQLLPLTGSLTMLQSTILRAAGLQSEALDIKAPLLICNEAHRFIIRDQCLAIGQPPTAIYLEPIGRNTAPAIALAALHLLKAMAGNDDALMLVLPADHVISDQTAFAQTVTLGAKAAMQGKLVTFGIKPTHPETGYGYIKAGNAINKEEPIFQVSSFVEKPDLATAKMYVNSGEYTWNSGMFLFKPSQYMNELDQHHPAISAAALDAWTKRSITSEFIQPSTAEFKSCPSDSIDYAVMQKTAEAAVVPADIGWNDVGAWDALWQISKKDEQGNVTTGDVFTTDTRNSFVRAENRFVSVIGVDDIVVIETADAVLVMHKSKAQAVKKAIEHCQNLGRNEHLEHTRTHQPWGWHENLEDNESFKINHLMLKPGEKALLPSQHWIVANGIAKLSIDDQETVFGTNQSINIPSGRPHLVENPSQLPLHIIGIQPKDY